MVDLKNIKGIKFGVKDPKLYLGSVLVYPTTTESITVTSIKPTSQNVAQLVSFREKPSTKQPLELATPITRPTLEYLVYPLDWEVMQNGIIVKPTIEDSNGFEVGFDIDEDTPTLTSNGVVYRVLNIELGVDNYTIEF